MKMTREHYGQLKTAIRMAREEQPNVSPNNYSNESTNFVRFRWDMFAAIRREKFDVRVLYNYLDDTAIDTALKCLMHGG